MPIRMTRPIMAISIKDIATGSTSFYPCMNCTSRSSTVRLTYRHTAVNPPGQIFLLPPPADDVLCPADKVDTTCSFG